MNGNRHQILRFEGFSPQVFDFLGALSVNNNKEWFAAHRTFYQSCIQIPVKAFASEAGNFIQYFSKELETEPRVGGTISLITNRARSGSGRNPYRPYISVNFSKLGERWPASPGMYLGLFQHGISMGFRPSYPHRLKTSQLQPAIGENQRLFQRYLDERRIAQRYWELTDDEDGETKKWPLPKTARKWATADSFTVGEYFKRDEPILGSRLLLDRVFEIFLDMFPLWIFATADNVRARFDEYAETSRTLTQPSTAAAD